MLQSASGTITSIPVNHPALTKLIVGIMDHSDARSENLKRQSYAPWLKNLLLDCQAQGLPYETLSMLTSIPLDSLKKFKSQNVWPNKEPLDEKSLRLKAIWDEASIHHRKTLEHFTLYISRHHQLIGRSFKTNPIERCRTASNHSTVSKGRGESSARAFEL